MRWLLRGIKRVKEKLDWLEMAVIVTVMLILVGMFAASIGHKGKAAVRLDELDELRELIQQHGWNEVHEQVHELKPDRVRARP